MKGFSASNFATGPTMEIVILSRLKYLAIIAFTCSAVTALISFTYSK